VFEFGSLTFLPSVPVSHRVSPRVSHRVSPRVSHRVSHRESSRESCSTQTFTSLQYLGVMHISHLVASDELINVQASQLKPFTVTSELVLSLPLVTKVVAVLAKEEW
jgi:hypothetical protein